MSVEKVPVFTNFPAEEGQNKIVKWIKNEIYNPIAYRVNGLLDGYKETTIVTDSPYTILPGDEEIPVDTNSGDVTLLLPAGIDGKGYRIINIGSSGNEAIITPDGTELLIGDNSTITVSDTEAIIIVYVDTKGWW